MHRTVTLLSCIALLAGVLPHAGSATVIALLAVENRAGDHEAATVVLSVLRQELAPYGELVEQQRTRDSLRRLRIRDGDTIQQATLRQLGEELGADLALSATLHDADRRNVPRLSLSARAYAVVTGELLWAGFEGASGLDRRSVLGLGTVGSIEELAPRVARRLVADFAASAVAESRGGTGHPVAPATGLGTVAILPFAGSVTRGATSAAETLTEASRAAMFRQGVRMASPHCTGETLRRLGIGRWGEATPESRSALSDGCGADAILTGSVEIYEVSGAELEPEPRVAFGMRLVDARTGRILWMGARERAGWDRPGLFRAGRIYSRGRLTERLMHELARELLRKTSRRELRAKETG